MNDDFMRKIKNIGERLRSSTGEMKRVPRIISMDETPAAASRADYVSCYAYRESDRTISCPGMATTRASVMRAIKETMSGSFAEYEGSLFGAEVTAALYHGRELPVGVSYADNEGLLYYVSAMMFPGGQMLFDATPRNAAAERKKLGEWVTSMDGRLIGAPEQDDLAVRIKVYRLDECPAYHSV